MLAVPPEHGRAEAAEGALARRDFVHGDRPALGVSYAVGSDAVGNGGLAETLRLKRLQQPSQIERLLETFIARSNFLPADLYQIRDPDALPATLRRLAITAPVEGRVWSGWASALHVGLFTCEMSLLMSRERGATVLQVNRYNEDGELQEAGSWMPDREGKWRRCAD